MTIEEALNAIKNAIYGKDVRQAMHDGILQAEGGAGTVAKKAELYAREAEIASKAIEGKADQAVSIATSAKNKSDSTQLQLDEIVINGDSSVEAAQARVDIENITHDTLKARLDKEQQEVTTQLAQTLTKAETGERALNYYWNPETQPAARKDKAGYFMDAFNMTAPEYIDEHFEPLRNANADYITRETMGKDASGTYDIWRYIFTPKNYKKTILISTCLHGGEVSPMVAMVRFLHHLLNDWEKYPNLAYIHENVRIVYTPFVNPWGVSQKPRTRYNSNGVDLNRNFPQGWDNYISADPAFGHDYKGGSSASEVETQYFMQNLADYPDAIACFDFHNTGQTSRHFYSVLPTGYPHKTFHQLVDYFSAKWGVSNPDAKFEQEGKPNACEWVWSEYGIPAAHPEWCDTAITGQSMYDSDEVTYSLAWFTNVITEHCRFFGAKVEITDKNVKNSLLNSTVTDDATGWERGGLSAPVVSNGVLQTTAVSGSNTPYLFGQLTTSDLSAGDVIFAAVEVKVPERCTSIELNLRDTTLGVTDNFTTITNPPANRFIKLNGTVVASGISSNTKLQIRFLFKKSSDVLGKNFELSKPIVVGTDNRANPSDLKYAIDKNGFFSGNKTITYVNNASSLDETQKSILGYMISKG